MKKILIINSNDSWRSKHNLNIYEELIGQKIQFLLLSNNRTYRDYFKKNESACLRLFGIINPQGIFSSFAFIILLPLIWVISLFALIYFKKSRKVDTILLYNLPEKIIFTPPAKILSINSAWLEMPTADSIYPSFLLKKLLIFSSRRTRAIIAYCQKTKAELLKLGIKSEQITLINPGISLSFSRRQENIFDSMAEKESRFHQRKFFTIGTENELIETEKIKTLLQAAEKCIDVIPNLQIIIMGEGPEKKNLSWLVRKMGIENIVWFVGEQHNLNKWLSNLDVFVYSKNNFNLDDISSLNKASAAGVPIVCPNGIGLDDFVVNKVNGMLIDPGSEDLTETIIMLEQNNNLRNNLSRQAKNLAYDKFNMQNTINSFKAAIGL